MHALSSILFVQRLQRKQRPLQQPLLRRLRRQTPLLLRLLLLPALSTPATTPEQLMQQQQQLMQVCPWYITGVHCQIIALYCTVLYHCTAFTLQSELCHLGLYAEAPGTPRAYTGRQ